MRQFTNTTQIEWDPDLSIPTMLRTRLEERPDSVMWECKASLGSQWIPVTTREFVEEVRALAQGFIASGVQRGDAIAILSATRYEFTLIDFASWWIGALPVGIYQTDSPMQIEHILDDSEITLVITETESQADVIREMAQNRPLIREVLTLDNGAIDTLRRRGEEKPELAEEVESRALNTHGTDLATIIYTSGATGRPKGVELTHKNFTFIGEAGRNGFPEVVMDDNPRTLLFLPLAHVFARFVEVLVLCTNTVMGHSPDTKNLIADLSTFEPTYLLTAPRVLEKVYNAADAKTGGGLKQKVFRWSAKASIGHSRARQARDLTPYLSAKRAVADALVLSKVRAIMGKKLKFIVSGGAPFSPRLGHFFRGAGFHVVEGYGLSETTAPLAVNPPLAAKIGSVGQPFPQVSVRISDEDEIQVKGECVFRGYHNDPELTAQSFTEDGWFKTGDLGSLDDEGFIWITGRAKDVIVTAGGKNVSPGVVEDRLRGHPLVSQAVAVGEGKPFIGALVTLDTDMLPGWLANHDIEPLTVAEAAKDPRVLRALDAAVVRANEPVSRAESIRKFTVLTEDFTEANGLLTPSMKVKRGEVVRRFSKEIEAMYGTNAATE